MVSVSSLLPPGAVILSTCVRPASSSRWSERPANCPAVRTKGWGLDKEHGDQVTARTLAGVTQTWGRKDGTWMLGASWSSAMTFTGPRRKCQCGFHTPSHPDFFVFMVRGVSGDSEPRFVFNFDRFPRPGFSGKIILLFHLH